MSNLHGCKNNHSFEARFCQQISKPLIPVGQRRIFHIHFYVEVLSETGHFLHNSIPNHSNSQCQTCDMLKTCKRWQSTMEYGMPVKCYQYDLKSFIVNLKFPLCYCNIDFMTQKIYSVFCSREYDFWYFPMNATFKMCDNT